MESARGPGRSFDHLREQSIGLPQVLFQSITHMAPGAAIAFSIYLSIVNAGPALPLAVLFALVACTLVALSIGQLAKEIRPRAASTRTSHAHSAPRRARSSGGATCSSSRSSRRSSSSSSRG